MKHFGGCLLYRGLMVMEGSAEEGAILRSGLKWWLSCHPRSLEWAAS